MLHTHRYRHIAALFLAAAALAACTAETESPAVEPNVPSVAAQVEEAPGSAAPAALQEQQDAVPQAAPEVFDVGGLPVSTAPLGTHPYFSIPEGHRGNPRKTFHAEFASAAFWTGDRFEVIEGPVYATGIRRAGGGGPSFSALQVAGELEQAITAAGGVKIFDGQVPPGEREDEAMTRVMEPYDTEAKCWAHDPVRIYVIRRDDREIWIRSCLNRRFAGLIVAETGDVVLKGDQALSYVRARKVYGDPTFSDYGRMQRQQQFLSSLLRKVMSTDVLLDMGKLTGFVQAFAQSTFGENIGVDQMITLAQSMRGMDAGRVTFLTVPTVGEANERGNEVLLEADVDELFESLIENTPLPGEEPAGAPDEKADQGTDSATTQQAAPA